MPIGIQFVTLSHLSVAGAHPLTDCTTLFIIKVKSNKENHYGNKS